MSAGSMSGVNWMRWKLRADRARERLERQRLGEAGHAFEQHMPAGEQRDEQAIDQGMLADDDAADLGAQRVDPAGCVANCGLDGADIGRDRARRAAVEGVAEQALGGRRNEGGRPSLTVVTIEHVHSVTLRSCTTLSGTFHSCHDRAAFAGGDTAGS